MVAFVVGRFALASRWGLVSLPAAFSAGPMHLLYLDDSGSVGNASDRHIILAGVSVFERKPHWFSQSLDRIADGVWPNDPQHLEFRGADIFSGKRHWRGVERDVRDRAYCDALKVLADSTHTRLFGAAIHKAAVSPADPMEAAFEQVASRFDQMLGRLHKSGDTQRGLIILDKSSYETSLQKLATEFKLDGHRWGKLHNLAEVPLFVDSRATRMIQYADMVAYALRRYYEKGEAKYFDIIKHRFDGLGGVIHGLTHQTPAGSGCNCAPCAQRARR